MPFIRGNDVVAGTDVEIIMEIEGKRYSLLYAKNWETTAETTQDDVPRIGTRVVGSKNGTVKFTGSMTVYYMDPTLRRVYMDYVKNRKWPEIIAIVRNEDKESRSGAQTAVHTGIKFSKVTISKFDAESSMLDEDIDFTFEEADIPEEFTPLPETLL